MQIEKLEPDREFSPILSLLAPKHIFLRSCLKQKMLQKWDWVNWSFC
jgi:hypothetical protein